MSKTLVKVSLRVNVVLGSLVFLAVFLPARVYGAVGSELTALNSDQVNATGVANWTAFAAMDRLGSQGCLLVSTLLFLTAVVAVVWLRCYSLRVVLPARQAHKLIIERDDFSSAIIQSVPIAVCVLRRGDSSIVLKNELAHVWFGDAQQIQKLSQAWALDSCFSDQTIASPILINHQERELELTCSTSRYEGQDVVVCSFIDVTAQKAFERSYIEARMAAHALRETQSVLLETMSTQMRTPLYSVLGTLELMSMVAKTPQQRTQLDTLQSSSAILMQIISDVLDVSRIESGQMVLNRVSFSPLTLVESVLQAHANAAREKGLRIYACIDPHIPGTVMGDPVRVRQILNNLVSNGIKFTGSGRVVVRLNARREGSRCHLEWQVADTGYGIAQEQQAHLFEPFYQTHGRPHAVGGTGLGLPICWRLAQLMAGDLKVVSEPGLGSSFVLGLFFECAPDQPDTFLLQRLKHQEVYLRSPVKELTESLRGWLSKAGAVVISEFEAAVEPGAKSILVDVMPGASPAIEWKGGVVISCDEHLPASVVPVEDGYCVGLHSIKELIRAVALAQNIKCEAEAEQPETVVRQKLELHILAAEDNPINQHLLKEQLQELGCSVVMAINGLEGMHSWHQEAFDVVLTDVNMPVMNGYEFAAEVRKHDADIPIIGVTANDVREQIEQCVLAGMNSCLVKPLSLLSLYNALLRMCPHLKADEQQTVQGGIIDHPVSTANVPENIRQLFVDTMVEDFRLLSVALAEDDRENVGLLLHRILGGLVVVQADNWVTACEEIRGMLTTSDWDFVLKQDVFKRIAGISSEVERL